MDDFATFYVAGEDVIDMGSLSTPSTMTSFRPGDCWTHFVLCFDTGPPASRGVGEAVGRD